MSRFLVADASGVTRHILSNLPVLGHYKVHEASNGRQTDDLQMKEHTDDTIESSFHPEQAATR